MLLELLRDDLGDEQITDDVIKREIAVDKELIRLIQMACKQDNIPRAIEVTRLLHHSASFDMAIKVADFYHLVGLSEKIELLKVDREAEERMMTREERGRSMNPDLSTHHSLVDPIAVTKPVNDPSQPPATLRPGLARALPHVDGTHYPIIAAELASHTYLNPPSANSLAPDGKRKRVGDGESVVEECSKRQAVYDSDPSTPSLACA
jgi:chromosome transmission fidelity protein 4